VRMQPHFLTALARLCGKITHFVISYRTLNEVNVVTLFLIKFAFYKKQLWFDLDSGYIPHK